MPFYIYADETDFKIDENDPHSRHVGSGLLLTETTIDRSIISRALKNLGNDPKLSEEDKRTLRRDCFHASEDTRRARKHLCREIARNVNGDFLFTYLKTPKEVKPKSIIKRSQKLALVLSALQIFSSKQKIIFVIEERQEFHTAQANNLIEDLRRQIEKQIYDLPIIPYTFPKINVSTDKKQNPGLQVVDLILWSVNSSKKVKPERVCLDTLNLIFEEEFQRKNGLMKGGRYHINCKIKIPLIKYPSHILSAEKEISNEELYKSYVLIENTICSLLKQSLPDHTKHLENNLQKVANQFAKSNFRLSVALLRKLSSVFLRFFDTLPLYNKEDSDSRWKSLLMARKMAALFLRRDLPNGVRSCDFIVHRRNLKK